MCSCIAPNLRQGHCPIAGPANEVATAPKLCKPEPITASRAQPTFTRKKHVRSMHLTPDCLLACPLLHLADPCFVTSISRRGWGGSKNSQKNSQGSYSENQEAARHIMLWPKSRHFLWISSSPNKTFRSSLESPLSIEAPAISVVQLSYHVPRTFPR